MRITTIGLVVIATAAASSASAADDTSAQLQQKTQALMDAITYGKPDVWKNLLDDKFVMTDETGAVSNKAEAVAQVAPLPKGISGNIRVTEWRATIDGDVAVATHLDDEHENYHGQKLHALYRATSTWIRRATV